MKTGEKNSLDTNFVNFELAGVNNQQLTCHVNPQLIRLTHRQTPEGKVQQADDLNCQQAAMSHAAKQSEVSTKCDKQLFVSDSNQSEPTVKPQLNHGYSQQFARLSNQGLARLVVRIRTRSDNLSDDDIAVIFAEPTMDDLKEGLIMPEVLSIIRQIVGEKIESVTTETDNCDKMKRLNDEGYDDPPSVELNHEDVEVKMEDQVIYNMQAEVEEMDESLLKTQTLSKSVKRSNVHAKPDKRVKPEQANEKPHRKTRRRQERSTSAASKNDTDPDDPIQEDMNETDNFDAELCPETNRFHCSLCNKSYKMKAELKKHVQIKHKGLLFRCDLCDVSLSTSQSLKRHVRTVHDTMEKRHKCKLCDKSFKDVMYLSRHMRTHENVGAKTFECAECGKFFKYSVTLKAHIKIFHEKVLRNTCEDCGKGFPDIHKLQVHREMAHMKGEVYVCQICGKEMLGKNRLRNHMLTHPKGQKFVSCQHCGKEVPDTQLRSHIVSAHKMASYKYQCPHCPKRLDTKPHIRAHIRKHTGARPYVCRGCDKSFVLLDSGQKHTKIYHEGDYSLIFYDPIRDVNNPYVTGACS